MNSRLAPCALLLVAVLTQACHIARSSGQSPGPDTFSGLFNAGIQHVASKTLGWTLHVDPRFMEAVTTDFDVERDGEVAPAPRLLPSDPLLQEREAMLDRLAIPQERIEEYAACTRYLGGIPYTGPDSRANEPEGERERRRACASRGADAAAIFGRPQRLADEGAVPAWSMRVYILTPVSREVSDLILVPGSGGRWTVARSIEVLNVTS